MPDLYLDDEQRLALDLDALVGSHLGIIANAGGGKSGMIRKLLETTSGRIQQIVLDSEDEFYTLRQQHDFVIAGGDGGDCPATLGNAAALATSALASGFNLIVQMNDMGTDGANEFVERFLSSMMEAPREFWHPCLIVIDETQRFDPATIRMLTERGRKRGYTAVLASQRLPKIDANIRGDINNWILGRVGQTLDRRIMADQLGMTAREAQKMLTGLRPRHFWAMGPALAQEPALFKAGDVQTTIVKPGQTKVITPPAPEALRDILAQLSTEPAAEDPEHLGGDDPDPELQRQLESYKRRNARLFQEIQDWQVWADRVRALFQDMSFAQSKLGSFLESKPGEMVEFTIPPFPTVSIDPPWHFDKAMKEPASLVPFGVDLGSEPVSSVWQIGGRRAGKTAAIETAQAQAVKPEIAVDVGPDRPPSVEKLIAEVAKWHPRALPVDRIAQLAGVSMKSSAWRRNYELLLESGDVQNVNGRLQLTNGYINSNRLASLPEMGARELLAAFRDKLPPSTGRVLGLLASNSHDSFTKAQIAELAEISPTSSGLSTALRELKAFELIQQIGDLYSAADIFREDPMA